MLPLAGNINLMKIINSIEKKVASKFKNKTKS